jgi:hypothetical protein
MDDKIMSNKLEEFIRKYQSIIIYSLCIFFYLYLYRKFTFEFSTMDWDEITYMIIGHGIRNGLVPFVDLWDIKPVGIYLIYSVSSFLFGYTFLAIRWMTLLFILLGSLGIYFNLKKYNDKIGMLMGLVYAYCFFYFQAGLSGNTEVYFNAFEIWSIYFLLNTSKKYLSAFLFGISFIVKYIVFFDGLLIYSVYIFISKSLKTFSAKVNKLFQLGLVIGIPFFAIFLFYIFTGHTASFMDSIFAVTGRYGKSLSLLDKIKSFFSFFKVFIPFILFIFILYIYKRNHRKILSKKLIIFSVWWIASWIGATWTGFLFDHYFLGTLSPLILLFGISLSKLCPKRFTNHLYVISIIAILAHSLVIRNNYKKQLDLIPDVPKQIANVILKEGNGTLFVASGIHSTYIALNQLPTVRIVQPVNYMNPEFSKKFLINNDEIMSQITDVKYIQWCKQYDLLSGEGDIPDDLNKDLVIKLTTFMKDKFILKEEFPMDCKLYYKN